MKLEKCEGKLRKITKTLRMAVFRPRLERNKKASAHCITMFSSHIDIPSATMQVDFYFGLDTSLKTTGASAPL
jgi:hypothetical protein